MDIICTNCGEPWDTLYVRHEAKEGFSQVGPVIVSCPCCEGRPQLLSPEQREYLATVRQISVLLGDDIDDVAACLEDFNF